MKTTIKKKYLLFAAAALTLTACSNDDENLNGGPVELRLSSSLEVQTRAATDIQGSAFETGQSVDVFIHEYVTSGAATTTYPQPLAYTTGASGAMTPSTQPYFPSSGNSLHAALLPLQRKRRDHLCLLSFGHGRQHRRWNNGNFHGKG